MAATWDITTYNNAVYTFNIVWQTSGASPTPIDLTNYTALLQVRPYAGANVVLFSIGTFPNTGISLGTTNGDITIEIAPSEYSGIQPGTYVYDLVMIDPSNNPTPILSGNFVINQGVSEPNDSSVVLTTSQQPATIANLTVTSNLSSTGTSTLTSVAISGGTIDNTSIGGTTPAAGKFTNLSNTGNANITNLITSTAKISGGTIDGTIIGGTTPSIGHFSELYSTGAASFAAMTITNFTGLGGTINNTEIGNTTASSGAFTTLSASTSFTMPYGSSTSSPLFETADAISDFIVSGLIPAVPSSSLTMSTPAGIAYISGQRVVIGSSVSHTYTASQTTYVDLSNTGVFTYTTSSTVTANSLRLFSVVTSSTAITSVTQIALSHPNIIIADATANDQAINLGQGNSLYNPLLGYTPIRNVFTTVGDMVYQSSTGEARVPIGTANQVLSVSGGIPTWVTLTGSSTLTATDVDNALGYTPAKNGANSDITSITGLTTALTVAQGGTGVKTITGVIKGNGASAFSAANATDIDTALGYTPAHSGANSDITSLTGLTSPLAVPNATAAGEALTLGQAQGQFQYSGAVSGDGVIGISAATTLTASQSGSIVYCSAGSAAYTVTLPAIQSGLKFRIYGNNTYVTNVAVNGASSEVMGFPDGSTATSFTIPLGYYDYIDLICDGSNWRAVTVGKVIASPAASANQLVTLGQIQNGSEYAEFSTLSCTGNIAGKTSGYSGVGLTVGWNQSSGTGEVNFLVANNGATGGFNFYQVNGSGALGSRLLNVDSSGNTTIPGTLTCSNATSNNQAVALGQLTNASISPNFYNGIQITSSGGSPYLYSDPSGTNTAGDFVARIGVSGSYQYHIWNNTGYTCSGVLQSSQYVLANTSAASNSLGSWLRTGAGADSGTDVVFRTDGGNTFLYPWGVPVGRLILNNGGSSPYTQVTGTLESTSNLLAGGDIYLGSQWIRPNSNHGAGMQLTNGGRLYLPNGDSYSINGYGYVSYENAGVITGSSSATFGLLVSNRIQCGELDATSDERLKDNIDTLSYAEGMKFVLEVNPRNWTWNDKSDSKGKGVGYVSQEVAKQEFDHLISATPNDKLEKHIADDDFLSPEGMQLNLNYNGTIPYLHAALKGTIEKLQEALEEINSLKQDIAELKGH